MSKEIHISEENFHQLGDEIRDVATEQQTLRDVQPNAHTAYLDTVGVSPNTRYIDGAEVDGARVSRDSTVAVRMKDGDLDVDDIDTRITSKAETTAGEYKTAIAAGAVESQRNAEYLPKTTVTRVENGKTVVREIKNPRAAVLVTRLAIKKVKQADVQERGAA